MACHLSEQSAIRKYVTSIYDIPSNFHPIFVNTTMQHYVSTFIKKRQILEVLYIKRKQPIFFNYFISSKAVKQIRHKGLPSNKKDKDY